MTNVIEVHIRRSLLCFGRPSALQLPLVAVEEVCKAWKPKQWCSKKLKCSCGESNSQGFTGLHHCYVQSIQLQRPTSMPNILGMSSLCCMVCCLIFSRLVLWRIQGVCGLTGIKTSFFLPLVHASDVNWLAHVLLNTNYCQTTPMQKQFPD